MQVIYGNLMVDNDKDKHRFFLLASSAVERGFKPKTILGICCFSAKHAALRRKSKDWLTPNQNNVSEWGDMSTHRLLFH